MKGTRQIPDKSDRKASGLWIACLLLGLLAVTAVVWKLAPIRYEMYASDTIRYIRGVVTEVIREELEPSVDLPGRELGRQTVSVRLSGEDGGEEVVTFENYLSTPHAVKVAVGTRVIVKADCPIGAPPYYSVYQYDRTGGLCLALLFFAACMTLVGRSKGLRAALGLGMAVLLIGGALLPAVYNGWPPVVMTLLVCLAISAEALLLLNGFSRKTAIAILSTAAGLIGAAAFYGLLTALLRVTGYHIDEAEELILISRSTGLQIRQVLFSAILLSALGAVMDTTMSVASALCEMRQIHPAIRGRELFRSGMSIGGDMIGTMCQTLVLAFAGSSLATLLVLLSYGTQLQQFLSSDLVALEVLQALTGSLAVVLAVPVTAVLCALLAGGTAGEGRR